MPPEGKQAPYPKRTDDEIAVGSVPFQKTIKNIRKGLKMKKILTLVAAWGLSAAALSIATPADAGNLVIEARNVDDRVDIYYNGSHQESCTWAKNPGCSTGVEGSATGVVTIRFKLTNFVYRGFCLSGSCGKYAGDFYVSHNGRTIWSDSVARKNNTEGVKYDVTITCDLNRNSGR
jgi:hypothetical protein